MDAVAVLDDPKAGAQAKVDAARSLSGSKDPRAQAALAGALDVAHDDVRGAALDALRAGGAGTHFADALRASGSDPSKRRLAARVLRHLHDPATVPALAQALSDPDEEVRREAAHALAVFGAPAARDALERALADASSEVRYFAVLALSGVPGGEARAALEARRKVEQDEGVRAELERILGPR